MTVKETAGGKLYSLELDELKKPSDIAGGTLNERYHIKEGYDKLLQKIEKARFFLEKISKKTPDFLLRRILILLLSKTGLPSQRSLMSTASRWSCITGQIGICSKSLPGVSRW